MLRLFDRGDLLLREYLRLETEPEPADQHCGNLAVIACQEELTADAEATMRDERLGHLRTRLSAGAMIPRSALTAGHQGDGLARGGWPRFAPITSAPASACRSMNFVPHSTRSPATVADTFAVTTSKSRGSPSAMRLRSAARTIPSARGGLVEGELHVGGGEPVLSCQFTPSRRWKR